MSKGSAASRNPKGPPDGTRGGKNKLVAQNKKARHDYTVEDVFEAGMVLTGTEVKSLRQGRCSLTDAYASVQDGEVYLLGAHIPEYTEGTWNNHTPRRARKLLLHRKQIAELQARTRESGLALVPLSLYFKDGRAKVEIALGRGRKSYDKRQVLAERDAQKLMRNAMGRALKQGRR
ncbi:MAG: SsrA-binding protein SmpB [Actinobacteria bacterium]|nr:SsrA-binding protein SmpB [Actinomycetota bacterium]MBW3648328.1 SsrA-binding protein SmpB [Actinomycetota bacterium]